jgi:hypothetical protein
MALPTPNEIVNNPREFARVFLRILDKSKNLNPLTWNAVQADLHSHRTGRDLVLKARQVGISTYIQGEMFRRAVTSTRSTLTLAHDDDTTSLLRRMADRFWENCRFNDIQPLRKYANASLTTYPELNSEAIIAKAGSIQVGRGATLTDIHGSECAFWPDAEKIIAGATQAGNPDIILESTPNGSQGYFYELCMEAKDKAGVWNLHFYPWWWEPAYRMPLDPGEDIVFTAEEKYLVEKHNLTAEQIKWRRYKQKELKGLFIQEYPEDEVSCFLTSGNSFFGDLTGIFTAPHGATYQQGHFYRAGLDWGQSDDYTCMIVVDLTAGCMVDFLHFNRVDWKEIRRRVAECYHKWRLDYLIAEYNSIGSVNIEALNDMGVYAWPFETNNASKAKVMGDTYDVLHSGKFALMDEPILKHELSGFIANQLPSGLWRLEAGGGGHDDSVIGLALALGDIPVLLQRQTIYDPVRIG